MNQNYKLNINIMQQQDITLHFNIERTFNEEKRRRCIPYLTVFLEHTGRLQNAKPTAAE